MEVPVTQADRLYGQEEHTARQSSTKAPHGLLSRVLVRLLAVMEKHLNGHLYWSYSNWLHRTYKIYRSLDTGDVVTIVP